MLNLASENAPAPDMPHMMSQGEQLEQVLLNSSTIGHLRLVSALPLSMSRIEALGLCIVVL